MAVSDGDDITVVKDMGLVSNVFDDRTLAALTGHLAIGHTRYSTTGSSTWRNAQPVYRDVAADQFALGHNGNLVNTEELADEAGMLPGHGHQRQRPGGRADPAASCPATPTQTVRRPGPRAGADEGAAPAARAPSRSCSWTRATSSASATPTASGRCASAGSTTAGCWPRSARPRRRRRPLRPRARARRDGGHRRHGRRARCSPSPSERVEPEAVPLRVRLLRPARQPALRPERPRRPGAHGRAARRPGAGRGRPGHGRARVRHPRRRGLRPGQRHPLRPGPGQEPLHRPHVHRPQPGDAGARRAHEAQPAARQHRRASAWSWSTTPSCGAPPPGPWCRCCARPAPPRSTCGSRRRRTAGRASTAWTPAPGASCWPPT